jgi:hypothetical protein
MDRDAAACHAVAPRKAVFSAICGTTFLETVVKQLETV